MGIEEGRKGIFWIAQVEKEKNIDLGNLLWINYFYKLFNKYFVDNIALEINNNSKLTNHRFVRKTRANKVKIFSG